MAGKSWDDNLRLFLKDYKWPIIAIVVVVALSKGWVDVPLIDYVVDQTIRLVRAVIP